MKFHDQFMWGVASAAYQIEGAIKEDGKGLSIWDALTREKGRIKYGELGDVACDHYHRFKEDIALMKEMGVPYYRMSISWARVLPKGIGEINQKGLEFYSKVIDELLLAGIEPIITLYHWDLPYELHKQGGWKNPQMPCWFESYTEVVVKHLGDRVKYWITINEPQIFVGHGYCLGIHAPFEKCSKKEIGTIIHHVLLSHGKAVRKIREILTDKVKIGFAPTGPCVVPESNDQKSIDNARRLSFANRDLLQAVYGNSLWADPIFLGKYSEDLYDIFEEDMPITSEEEMKLIAQPLDFYGCNIYQSLNTKDRLQVMEYASNAKQGSPRTTMNWPVTPEVLFWAPYFFYERYQLPILITENGIAGMEWICLDGKIHDEMRIDYVHRYLLQLRKAHEQGIPVMGYLYWSVMDNFEWAEGYDKKFGLIHVDYETQKRTLKESAYWYRDVIRSNGGNL